MTELQSPGMRSDIIEALDVLATLTPATTERWPGLTEAVNWLVDNQLWDQFDVAESIGWTLRDEQEVAAIRAVLDPLLAVLDELGPFAADPDYLRHRRWPQVRTAAGKAQLVLTRST